MKQTDPSDPTGPAEQSARRVWHGMRALVLDNDRRKQVGEALGMSFNRVKALRRIAAEPLKLRSLADYLVIDAPYATLIVDDLAKRGLVERIAHPQDRRCKLVRVTQAGQEVADRADVILDTPPKSLLALPPEELAALDRIVGHLLG